MALIDGPHIPTPMQSGDRVVCRACGRPVTRRYTARSSHWVHTAGPRTSGVDMSTPAAKVDP